MLRNRLYYLVKPLLPLSMRVEVRRWFAQSKRARVGAVWPILPGSEKPPQGWPGWPEGKQFALAFTHDVEGLEGLERVRALAGLEMKRGFRSCFNFIPEGDYSVPRDLLDWLVKNGFEIGVHDLRHDGKLYHSRREFAENALRINQHLKNWNATGFRSGFMLHNLEWMHDLDVLYDSSTFDTDPFEPQPDGVGTIFPFWVPAPGSEKAEGRRQKADPQSDLRTPQAALRAGYVELPYTLPQDSTLFLLFREFSIDVWKHKVDWVAKHGGLALSNTHPDFMALNGTGQKRSEYPVEHYEKFLDYINSSFPGAYWHALPREIAIYWRQTMTGRDAGFEPRVEADKQAAGPL